MALAASEHQFVEKILVNAEDIQARTAEMGKQLAAEFADAKPLVVCVLRGAAPFHTDLTRAMQPAPVGIEVDYIRASSYHGAATTTSGDVQLTTAGAADVKGRTVILVEDICDTGTTLRKLVDYCRAAGANSVTVVSLLNKQARRVVDLSDVDLRIAFEIPDEFVIGFGLDFDERFRTLPYVGVLRPGTDIN